MTYGRDPAQKTLVRLYTTCPRSSSFMQRLKRVFRPMQHVYRAMLDPMIDLAAVIQDAEERARHDLVDFVQIRLIVHTAQHGDEGKGTSQDRIEVNTRT